MVGESFGPRRLGRIASTPASVLLKSFEVTTKGKKVDPSASIIEEFTAPSRPSTRTSKRKNVPLVATHVTSGRRKKQKEFREKNLSVVVEE